MKERHPSGKPVRQPKRGIPHPMWPREGYLLPRLNYPQRDLTGGFGFRVPDEPEDSMYLETRTKR